MTAREEMEFIIRSVDDAILISDTGIPLSEKSVVDIDKTAQVTITKKMMPLDSELYFFYGIVVAFAAGIAKDVLTGLVSDWLKNKITGWKKQKKVVSFEKAVVILIVNKAPIEFWIIEDDVQVKYNNKQGTTSSCVNGGTK